MSAYMSAHVLLNLLNKLRKGDEMRGLQANIPAVQEHLACS